MKGTNWAASVCRDTRHGGAAQGVAGKVLEKQDNEGGVGWMKGHVTFPFLLPI